MSKLICGDGEQRQKASDRYYEGKEIQRSIDIGVSHFTDHI